MTVALADFVRSAFDVAVTVTVGGTGGSAGAVNSPPPLTVPTVAFPPRTPFTLNRTVVIAAPVTVAVNCCVAPFITFALVGDMLTFTPAEIVTVAVADLVGSATLVAVTVTVAGDGIVPGAVYKPVELMVPHAAPVQPAPETLKVTAVFVVPVTVAVNCSVPLGAALPDPGLRVTATGTAGAVTVTVDVADFVGSATLVARTVTVAGDGAVAGAV